MTPNKFNNVIYNLINDQFNNVIYNPLYNQIYNSLHNQIIDIIGSDTYWKFHWKIEILTYLYWKDLYETERM